MRAKGPKGNWLLGEGSLFIKDPLAFIMKTCSEHPHIATFRFGLRRVHLLSNPACIQHVLQKNHKNYEKGSTAKEMQNIFGKSMVVTDGEDWRKKRKISQPAFSKKKIEIMAKAMIDCTVNHFEKWKTHFGNKPFQMLHEMEELTLNIIGKTLFNSELTQNHEQLRESMDYLFAQGNARTQKKMNPPIWFPFEGRGRFLKKRKYILNILDKIIKKRLSDKGQYNDLLSMMLDAHDEKSQEGLSHEEIKREIMLMFFAGSESTSTALSMAIYSIIQNKTVEEKLINEINDILNKDGFKPEHVAQLNYTKSIIMETLRLYPPFWLIAREAIDCDDIENHTIKKKDLILISPYAMHRSGKFWDNPEAFHPERFLIDEKPNPHVYLPFGAGPRGCIGYHFAMMEMTIILALLYQNFTFIYEGNGKPQFSQGTSLRPKNGIPVRAFPLQ